MKKFKILFFGFMTYIFLSQNSVAQDTICEAKAAFSTINTSLEINKDSITTFTDNSITSLNTNGTGYNKRWDFGDGISVFSDNESQNHVYSEPGIYTVCLTIDIVNKDNFQCSDTYCEDINISWLVVDYLDTIKNPTDTIKPTDTSNSVIDTDLEIIGIDSSFIKRILYDGDLVGCVWNAYLSGGSTVEFTSYHDDMTESEIYLVLVELNLQYSNNYNLTFRDIVTVQNLFSGVEDLDSEIEVKAYPNPVVNELNIELPAGEAVVSVIDVTGQVLFSNTYDASLVKVDVSSLSKGLYFVKIDQGASSKTIQIVK